MRVAGKKVGGTLYIHRDYIPEMYHQNIQDALEVVPEDFDYVIVKIDPARKTISFIESDDFDTANEPSVGTSIMVDRHGNTRVTHPRGQIYHHKWMFVGDDYTNFNVDEAKLRSKQWLQYATPDDKRRIGYRSYWQQFLDQHGLEE